MNFQEWHEYIDAYIDNQLDVAAAILLKQHFRDCFGCQQLSRPETLADGYPTVKHTGIR